MLPAVLANLASLGVVIYFFIAFRRVYGGSWVETLVKGSCVGTIYFAVGFVANLLLVFGLLELQRVRDNQLGRVWP